MTKKLQIAKDRVLLSPAKLNDNILETYRVGSFLYKYARLRDKFQGLAIATREYDVQVAIAQAFVGPLNQMCSICNEVGHVSSKCGR